MKGSLVAGIIREGCNGGISEAQRIFKAVKLFCMIL